METKHTHEENKTAEIFDELASLIDEPIGFHLEADERDAISYPVDEPRQSDSKIINVYEAINEIDENGKQTVSENLDGLISFFKDRGYTVLAPKQSEFVNCTCTNELQYSNCDKNCGHGPRDESIEPVVYVSDRFKVKIKIKSVSSHIPKVSIDEANQLNPVTIIDDKCDRSEPVSAQWLSESKLRQLFKNNSDCYADTWKQSGGTMEEGEVIQAVTEDRFIEILTELRSRVNSVDPKEAMLYVFDNFSSGLSRNEVEKRINDYLTPKTN